jgi:endonuclease-8
VRAIDTHGKHLFLRFEGDLVLHSHLGMSGSWRVSPREPRSSRAWVVLRAGEQWVAEFEGPLLELLTEGRARFDQRLSQLGPDVLASDFASDRFLSRLAGDDPTRPLGDALLDQRNVAGIGNIWKAEGCWEAGIDPWRPVGRITGSEAVSVIDSMRPRMLRSATEGPRTIRPRVYRRTGQPCPRCGERIRARAGGYVPLAVQARPRGTAPRHPAGDANRTTYWCPGCQR